MDNATTVSTVIEGVNNMAGGWLIAGFLITLFIVSIMVFFGRVGIAEILLANGFFFSIIAVIFITMGLLPTWSIGITISIAIFGIIAIFMNK
jgi:hypothetical protein